MLYVDFSLSDAYKEFELKSPNIRSFLPKDAPIQHDRTTIRYHYTSANALMSILGNSDNEFGKIRFTDARFMNDRSEHLFFVKLLLEYMDKHRKEYPYCQSIISELLLHDHSVDDYTSLRISDFEDFEKDNVMFVKSRHFLFCLCKDFDSLHMWNYYIHNGNYQGYNIGIKLYDFLKSFDAERNDNNDPIRFYCGDVLYSKGKQEKEIEALCKTIEKMKINEGKTPIATQIAMGYLWEYIECYGLFYKDESFSYEKEYRIVIQFELPLAGGSISSYFKENRRGIDYNFFERNGVLVPFLSVPLSKTAVKQITIAPIMENRIASLSMDEFIEANGYNDVKVKQSEIPIRF